MKFCLCYYALIGIALFFFSAKGLSDKCYSMKIKDVVAYKGCVPLTENAEDYYCKNSPGIIGIFIFLNSFSKFKVVFHHHKSERINHSQDFKFFFADHIQMKFIILRFSITIDIFKIESKI